MRVGVFTPPLAQLLLESALKKIKTYNIDTVELGTGNYPGDAHCKLSMLDDAAEFFAFRKTLSDHGSNISALSCHGNPLHPDRDRRGAIRRSAARRFCWPRGLGFASWSSSPAVPAMVRAQHHFVPLPLQGIEILGRPGASYPVRRL